jgi:hypothetical protein
MFNVALHFKSGKEKILIIDHDDFIKWAISFLEKQWIIGKDMTLDRDSLEFIELKK